VLNIETYYDVIDGEIIDLNGKSVKKIKYSVINIHDLEKGIYILRLVNNKEIYQEKIVKN
jgi:hypothetical protein